MKPLPAGSEGQRLPQGEDARVHNKAVQRGHYDADALARLQREGRGGGGTPGSAAFWAELQAPYRFAEACLLRRGVEGRRILDYGCGYGAEALFLAQYGARVTAVDISPETLKVARDRAALYRLAGSVEFEEGDCEALPHADDTFDFVVSWGTLSCLDLRSAYAELSRVTKPTGHVVVIEALGHNPLTNFSRWVKLQFNLKTEWTAKHTVTLRGLDQAREYFGAVELNYFDLVTLPLIFLRMVAGGRRLVPGAVTTAAQRIDRWVLCGEHLSKCAYKVVCVLSQPKKRAESNEARGS